MAANYRPGATVLEAIGSTPLIQVDGIFVKLEYLNPSGSIKVTSLSAPSAKVSFVRATPSLKRRAATPATR
jgi:hypothetical protein